MINNLKFSIGHNKNSLYDNIELFIPSNGIISFIGENGSGKSTIYKTLLGIIPPIKGTIPESIKANSCIISDYISIPEEVKVKDLFYLLETEHIGNTRKNYPNIYEYVSDISNSFVKKLSSGQRKILEIFMVLSSGKKILLLDEASNSLDYKNKKIFLDIIKKLSQKDILVIHTSHDFDDVVTLKGSIFCLFKNEKKIKQYIYDNNDLTIEDLKNFLYI